MSSHDEQSIEEIQRELHHTLSGMSMSEAQQALVAAKKMMEELQAQQERSQSEVLEAKKKLAMTSGETKKKKNRAATTTGGNATTPPMPSVSSSALGGKHPQDIQALLKEAQAAREEMDRARREVDEKLANTQKAMKALDEAKHQQQELGQQLDSASAAMGSMNASEIEKLGENAAIDSTATTSAPLMESKSPGEVDLYGALPRMVLEVDAQSSLLMAGGQLVVNYSVSKSDASHMNVEEVYNDEDTLYLSCVDNHVLKKNDKNTSAGHHYPMLSGNDSSAHWYTSDTNSGSNDNPNIGSSEDLHVQDIYLSGSQQKAHLVTQETAYDTLEYTNGMTIKQGVHQGQTILVLPTYAATYVLHYVRTLTHYHNRDGSVSKECTAECIRVSKSRVVISTYKHYIQVPAPLIYGSPHHSQNNKKKTEASGNIIASANKWTKRKGGSMQSLVCMSNNDGSIFTEDLKHISTLCMTITLSLGTTSRRVSRIMAWLCTKSSNDVHHYGYKIVMEMDVWEGKGGASLNTRCLSYHLPFLPVYYQLDVSRSVLELVPSSDTEERISIRIPYTVVKQPISTTVSATGTASTSIDRYDLDARMSAMINNNDNTDENISCAFCGSALIDLSRNISECRLLPTGIFDDMMHDFICVEDSSQMNLCSTDITTPQGMLLIGPLMITINPSDVASSTNDSNDDGNSNRVVRVDCKNAPSMLDLYNGYGGSLATSPFNADSSNNKGASTKSMLPSVVNIDTCTLSCARCRAYVGDGQLSSDCTDPNCLSTHLPMSKTNTIASNEGGGDKEESLSFADIRDVRLSRHCVKIPLALLCSIRDQNDYADVANYELPLAIQPSLRDNSIGKDQRMMNSAGEPVALNIEQAIARSILHLNEVFNVHTFLIHVSHSPMASSAVKDHNDGGSNLNADLSPSMVIVCRLMGKDYQWTSQSLKNDNRESEAYFSPGLKLSYKYGRLGARGVKVSGKEARIPVKYHEIVSLLRIFKERSEQCGAMSSVLKGQTIVNLML